MRKSFCLLLSLIDDEALAARLRARPAWRNTSDKLIMKHVQFNRWLKEHAVTASPPVALIDTTRAKSDETAARVASWIRAHAGTRPSC